LGYAQQEKKRFWRPWTLLKLFPESFHTLSALPKESLRKFWPLVNCLQGLFSPVSENTRKNLSHFLPNTPYYSLSSLATHSYTLSCAKFPFKEYSVVSQD
jgi:hypothetical protein